MDNFSFVLPEARKFAKEAASKVVEERKAVEEAGEDAGTLSFGAAYYRPGPSSDKDNHEIMLPDRSLEELEVNRSNESKQEISLQCEAVTHSLLGSLVSVAAVMTELAANEAVKLIVCSAQVAGGAACCAVGVTGCVATLGYSDLARTMPEDGYRNIEHGSGAIMTDVSKCVLGVGIGVGVGFGAVAAPIVTAGIAGGLACGCVGTKVALDHSEEEMLGTKEAALEEVRRNGWPLEQEPQQLYLYELAELACDVYEDECQLLEANQFNRTTICLEDLSTVVRVYQHKKRALAVIAIRGTQLDYCPSVVRDLQSIIGSSYPGEMVIPMAELINELQQAGNHVMVTGHSLGGYLAEVVATTFKLGGAGFNAPGPGEHNNATEWPWFCTINHEGDNIGNFMARSHQSDPVFIEDGGVVKSLCHGIQDMVTYMQKRKDWKNWKTNQYCEGERRRLLFYATPALRSYRD